MLIISYARGEVCVYINILFTSLLFDTAVLEDYELRKSEVVYAYTLGANLMLTQQLTPFSYVNVKICDEYLYILHIQRTPIRLNENLKKMNSIESDNNSLGCCQKNKIHCYGFAKKVVYHIRSFPCLPRTN